MKSKQCKEDDGIKKYTFNIFSLLFTLNKYQTII